MYNPLAEVPWDQWRRIPQESAARAMERDILQGGRFIYLVPGPVPLEVVAALDDRYGPQGWTQPWVYQWAKAMDGFIEPSWVTTPAFKGVLTRTLVMAR